MEVSPSKPTIKGIFVNSHIKALSTKKGDGAIAELEKRFGRPVIFNNSENVLISDEVKIIEICLDLLFEKQFSGRERAYEAGRLHFQNFSTTPLAKIVFSLFKNSFKIVMLNADKIAGHVFSGVRFSTQEISEKSVVVRMENNDYPLEHFQGLFSEWMSFTGLTGEVAAKETVDGAYEYIMSWK